MCTLPKPPAGRALSEGKEAPQAAFPSWGFPAQTKRRTEGIMKVCSISSQNFTGRCIYFPFYIPGCIETDRQFSPCSLPQLGSAPIPEGLSKVSISVSLLNPRTGPTSHSVNYSSALLCPFVMEFPSAPRIYFSRKKSYSPGSTD